MVSSSRLADQLVGGGPRFLFGFAHDHVQANAELDLAAMRRCAGANVGDLLRDRFGRLAPRQIRIDMLARHIVRGRRRTAEPQRRMRILHRRIQRLAALRGQMLALEVDRFIRMRRGEQLAPDVQEFVGDFVARVVVDEHAVAFQFGRIAAGHDVDQQASIRQTGRRSPPCAPPDPATKYPDGSPPETSDVWSPRSDSTRRPTRPRTNGQSAAARLRSRACRRRRRSAGSSRNRLRVRLGTCRDSGCRRESE